MSEKQTSAVTWLQTDMVRNAAFGLLLCAGLYGVYYLLQYGRRQSAYKQNTVLAQALDEYQKAQQGYVGSWETLREIASIGAQKQSGTVVQPYLKMLQAQAQQHIQASPEAFDVDDLSTQDLVYFAWSAAESRSESVAVKDLLKISSALAGLDQAQRGESNSAEGDVAQHIKTLESFLERLTDTQGPCEHYFDDYASYMLAYYWYSRGEIERAQQIWTAVAAIVREGQEPTVWQQLSQSFLS